MIGAVIQPFLPGIPSSASFLVDRRGAGLADLAVGRQRIEVDERGSGPLSRGDDPAVMVPTAVDVDGRWSRRRVTSVPGLRGFVGVDFLEGPRGEVTVLEINPRPTTSYVGVVQLLPPGTIAGAWLGVGRARARRDRLARPAPGRARMLHL